MGDVALCTVWLRKPPVDAMEMVELETPGMLSVVGMLEPGTSPGNSLQDQLRFHFVPLANHLA
jgi:hypothetical protein